MIALSDLHKLPHADLETGLHSLVRQEKEVLHGILAHIREIHRRKLYLQRAKPNLFEYLTQDFGYSPAAAQRRIDAARLSSEIPEVLEKVRRGSLNLSQISAFQRAVRLKERLSKERLQPERKRSLLAKVETASAREAEAILAESLQLPIVAKTRTTVQGDRSVRLGLTLSPEDWEKMQQCRNLLGHKIPSGNWNEVLAEVLDFFLEKQSPGRPPKTPKSPKPAGAPPSTSASEAAPQQKQPKSFARKPIPRPLRREILRNFPQCQYVDPETGRKCGSRFRLEIDHVQMVCRGGGNEPENLRVLCRNHNQWLAEKALSQAPG